MKFFHRALQRWNNLSVKRLQIKALSFNERVFTSFFSSKAGRFITVGTIAAASLFIGAAIAKPQSSDSIVNRIVHEAEEENPKRENETSPKVNSGKKKLVILGTGWGAVSALQGIDLELYDIVIVSPRNFFLFTPMLPATTTGGVDYRSILDPIRSFIDRKANGKVHIAYYEAKAIDLDYLNQKVVCKRIHMGLGEKGTDLEYIFNVDYDELIIAVGSHVNTFNTPGVKEYCHFLKEVHHAQNIRRQLWSNLERAGCPSLSEDTVKQMLSIAVVGGGPTGVEFAGELNELLQQEVIKYFPHLAKYVTITIIQSQDHILNTFDSELSLYAEKKFLTEHINVVTNARVVEVKQSELVIFDKNTKKTYSLPFGVCLWSTGIKRNPLVEVISSKLGVQKSVNSLICDPYMRVRGIPQQNVYAIGDCSNIDAPHLVDKCMELFDEADTNKDGALSIEEISALIQNKASQYPQLKLFAKRISETYYKFDKNRDNKIDRNEFKELLQEADSIFKSLPATAQVASQQGIYISKYLNKKAKSIQYDMPFRFKYLGSFANLGVHDAVADISGYHGTGRSAYLMYRGVYLSKQVSLRNKFSLATDWLKTFFFGRDLSKF